MLFLSSSSRRNHNTLAAVVLVAAATVAMATATATTATATATAENKNVRGVRGVHTRRSQQQQHQQRRSQRSLQQQGQGLDLLTIVTSSSGSTESVAEDAGAASGAVIAEDAGKKKDDDDDDKKGDNGKKKDDKDDDEDDNNDNNNTDGTPNRQEDNNNNEPCGDINCAVTVDKPEYVQVCTNELTALDNCLRTKEDGITYVGGVPRQTWCPQRVNAAVAGSVACGTDAAQACDVFTTYGRNINDPCYYCEDLTKKYASCKIAAARTDQGITCPVPLSLEPDAATCQWVPSNMMNNNVVVSPAPTAVAPTPGAVPSPTEPAPAPTPGAMPSPTAPAPTPGAMPSPTAPAPAPTPGTMPSPTGTNNEVNIPAPTPADVQPVLPPICVEPENLPEPTGNVNVVPDREGPNCVDLSTQLDTCLASSPSTLMACKTCLVDTAMVASGCTKGSGWMCALLSVCRNTASCNGIPGSTFEECWSIAHELAKCEMEMFCPSLNMTTCVA